MMLGGNCLKSWSTTQEVVALSSGEAECYGMVRGGSQGLGLQEILRDLGVEAKIRIMTDASAAKGIACRRGVGRVKHIELNQLWLQDKVAKGAIEIRKVRTDENLADALTKYLDFEKIPVLFYESRFCSDGRAPRAFAVMVL